MNREIDDQIEITLLRKVIDSVNVPVFVLDEDGNYIFFNKAYQQLIEDLGLAAIAVGDHYPDLIATHVKDRKQATLAIESAFRGHSVPHLLTFKRLDQERYYDASYDLFNDGPAAALVISLNPISEKIRLERKLETKTKFLEGLLGHLPVVLYKLREDGTIVLADGAGLSGLGVAGEDLIGKNAFELFPNIGSRLLKAISGETARFVAPARMNGHVVFFENIIFNDFGEEDQEVTGFAIDVTPYKLSEKDVLKYQVEIQQQTEHLKSLNAFKDKILAIISHDLRAPIASLMTLLPFIDELSPEEITMVKKDAMQQIEEVSGLLDNLLHWAMNSFSKNLMRQSVAVDLYKLADGNIHLLGKQAATKRIDLSNHVIPGLEALADWDQINIVIRNLLANAIKFTPEGGSIELSSFSFDGYVAFSVKDSGIGMNAKQLEQLFSHESTSTCGTSGEKGTGLGLLLSKEYVDACGGQISAISAPGRGSTFTMLLPLFEK